MFKKFLKLSFYTCVCMFIGMCLYLYFAGSVTVAAVPGENKVTMEKCWWCISRLCLCRRS